MVLETNFDRVKKSRKYDLKFLFFLGLDIPKHGEPAYPLASYGDGWGYGKSQAGETKEFHLQLKLASPHKGGSPNPVQNGQSSMPGSQNNVIANPVNVYESPNTHTDMAAI